LKLRDATGGYRAFRRRVLDKIDYAGVASEGYCFQVDLARRALAAGFTVREVPITFVERERGESKMSGDIVREAFLKVGQWGVDHRRAQLRRRFGRS
jgi:dolichol-phosphate mannosyltransferase